MNRSLPTACRVTVALLASLWLTMPSADAQSQGYQAPNFANMGEQQFHQAQQIPAFPASPLAGGPAAASGGEYVDVQGNPIVVQTQYEEYCPPGMGGFGGGYGDPMAVDFGGYGQDQVGPHYFDISADVVFMQSTELFNDIGVLSSNLGGPAAGAPSHIDPESASDDYEAGFQVAVRYDIGALAVFEATYMGIYDFGFNETVNAVTVNGLPNSLYSSFSDFGTAGGGTVINGFDAANNHTFVYESELQSAELSVRRYWVGTNPRVSGTLLAGARYVRMTEDFAFLADSTNTGPATAALLLQGENDLVGFQFGGDGWIGLRQGLRIGSEVKAGVYNNSFKFRSALTAPSDPDYDVLTSGDQVAFVGEGGATIVADILPSISIRGGYKVMYLSSIATVGGSYPTDLTAPPVGTQGHALFHGFNGGLEYVW